MKGTLIILLLLLFSCTAKKTEFLDYSELEAYVNNVEHGFIVSEESAELLFEAKLTPSIRDDNEPQFTIQLRINKKDGGSVLDHGGATKDEVLIREGYLSFELLKDVTIEDNGHSIPALFHHYERNYGLKPSIDILFRFSHFDPKEDVTFNYRDELFGQGLIKLKFKKELFNKCYVKKS